MDTELCEKSSGRPSFAFDDFVEIGPVVAGTLSVSIFLRNRAPRLLS